MGRVGKSLFQCPESLHRLSPRIAFELLTRLGMASHDGVYESGGGPSVVYTEGYQGRGQAGEVFLPYPCLNPERANTIDMKSVLKRHE